MEDAFTLLYGSGHEAHITSRTTHEKDGLHYSLHIDLHRYDPDCSSRLPETVSSSDIAPRELIMTLGPYITFLTSLIKPRFVLNGILSQSAGRRVAESII